MIVLPKDFDGRAGRRASIAALAAAILVLVSGCGHSTVSSRQLDYHNGLAYLHGKTEPFTGTAHHERPPAFIEHTLGNFGLQTSTFHSTVYADECDVDFVEGVEEGDVRCTTAAGGKALSISIHRGRFQGEATAYNKAGKKLSVTRWKDGALDGEQEFYTADGKYMAHLYSVEDGHKRGKEVWRAQNGDDLAKGSWDDDGKFDGSLLADAGYGTYAITTYDDGVKDGPFFEIFTLASAEKPIVEGAYEDGKKDGTWTYHASSSPLPMVEFDSVMGSNNPFTHIDGAVTKTLTYDNGVLSGPVTVSDKDDNVLTSILVNSDGKPGPIKRFDPASGRKMTYDDPATLAAVNWQAPSDMQQMRLHGLDRRGPNSPAMPDPRLIQAEQDEQRHLDAMRAIEEVRPVPPVGAPVASEAGGQEDGDSASDTCVDGWISAFHQEQGADAPISADQLQEWQAWCQAGKTAP